MSFWKSIVLVLVTKRHVIELVVHGMRRIPGQRQHLSPGSYQRHRKAPCHASLNPTLATPRPLSTPRTTSYQIRTKHWKRGLSNKLSSNHIHSARSTLTQHPTKMPLQPLDRIPNLTWLYARKELSPPDSSTTTPDPDVRLNDIVHLIRTDITTIPADAIVNAANTSLLGGGGVDGVIHDAAGPGLLRECRGLDGCQTGSAKITDAYELPGKKVIHAVGPRYRIEEQQEAGRAARLLRGCYQTSLDLARDHGCKSIAFSCVSTGIYGYPSGEAAQEAIKTVREWLTKHEGQGYGGIERVIFCCFLEKDEDAYLETLPYVH